MAINERIHYFRNLRGMTQKSLGMSVGFSEKNADVRVAQYESGLRNPKADLTAQLAQVLQGVAADVGMQSGGGVGGMMDQSRQSMDSSGNMFGRGQENAIVSNARDRVQQASRPA